MWIVFFLLMFWVAPAWGQTVSPEALFDHVQERTFQYFWEGAEPHSGLARERIHCDGVYPSQDSGVVTSGGSGFGLMALLVGMERGWISRSEGLARLEKIANFLESADRFRGAWPHWWHGESGRVKAFSPKDDGGDLVESAFLAQGLLCVRQYFQDGSPAERRLARRFDQLWRGINFQAYVRDQALYWHWSPNHGWAMNFPIRGYNECLILYVLAASSPTHAIDPEVYHQGWAEGGKIVRPLEILGIPIGLRHQGERDSVGPLFWAHYSFLGLDPRGLRDRYADYEEETRNHARVHYQWCVENPLGHRGYGPASWGLTSSYSPKGYAGHAPSRGRDLGVIAPTAALASFPYLPQQAEVAMQHWYYDLGSKVFGPYGFYDAFSQTQDWYPQRYLAIDQGPIVVMMENHRSQLLWKLFMSCPEVQAGLRALEFQTPWQGT